MSDDPRERNRGAPDAFFADPVTDRMMAVLFNLAAEAWVQEERLAALEGRAPDPPDDAAKAFIDRIFAPLRKI